MRLSASLVTLCAPWALWLNSLGRPRVSEAVRELHARLRVPQRPDGPGRLNSLAPGWMLQAGLHVTA